MSSENIVKLNIGGTIFQTTESTLTKFDGMFKTMFDSDLPIKKDEAGCIFIDRSPKHFELILNFMRDGDVELPDSVKELKEIQKEAHFYLLTGLVDLCNMKPRVIGNESEHLEIITNPIKPVMIIHLPMKPNESIYYPEGFDVHSFLEKYKNHFDIHFKPFKVSFSDIRYCEEQFPSWSFYKDDFSSSGGTEGDLFLVAIEEDIEKFLMR